MEMLKPTSEYVARGDRDQEIERTVIPAFPPSRANKFHIQTLAEQEDTDDLPEYPIPSDLQKCTPFDFIFPSIHFSLHVSAIFLHSC